MATSLFVILARNGRDAFIFRRGPGKQVLLIKWDRRRDRFESGQWLKGRIYERRCDLSPSGDLLVYLAAKHKGPIGTWTAVSKPPYLTALALWPNLGTWGGGGLFESEGWLLLNHDAGYRKLADGFQVPKNMMVRALGEHAGRGEDDPIYHTRLLRDGWILKEPGEQSEHRTKRSLSWRFSPPRIYEKRMAGRKSARSLQMQLRGVHERQSHKYTLDYEVLSDRGDSLLKLSRIAWADWDSNGDLLFAEGGKLFRLPWTKEPDRDDARELADFTTLTFAPKEAPKWALSWDARRRR